MTTSVEPLTTGTGDADAPDPSIGRRWLGRAADCLSSAEHPSHLFGPNWFASVMGIGIVANAAAGLPILASALHVFAVVVWVIAVLWLLVLLTATSRHWLRHPDVARGYIRDPTMGQFYGAPPMALMTVGAGALLVGHSMIGMQAATDIDWVLWTAGTIGGLLTAVTIPYLLFTHYPVRPDGAFGGWLMPVVPPMVSAATGALLIPHVAAGAGRQTMLYGCYALFGISLVASLIIITMIWSRLAHFGSSGTVRVPTLWIVLGPLGQSITAAGLLGSQAHLAVSGPLASSLRTFSVLYGVPVWGFAMLWIALAASLTAHHSPWLAVRAHLVELHLSDRHLRDRHDGTGHVHRSARVQVGCCAQLWMPAGRSARGRLSHPEPQPDRGALGRAGRATRTSRRGEGIAPRTKLCGPKPLVSAAVAAQSRG